MAERSDDNDRFMEEVEGDVGDVASLKERQNFCMRGEIGATGIY